MSTDPAVQAAEDAIKGVVGLGWLILPERRALATAAVAAARPIERAAALREAAAAISADDFGTSDAHDPDYWAGLADAASYLRRAAVEARPIIDAEQRSKDAAEAAVISSSRMIEKAYRLGWERAAVRTEPEPEADAKCTCGHHASEHPTDRTCTGGGPDYSCSCRLFWRAAVRTEPENG